MDAPNSTVIPAGRAAVDLPPVIVAVARVGPTTATLVEFTVRSSLAGGGVTLAVCG